MPPPRPPSWIDPLRVPVFGMAWLTTTNTHWIAYSGGGGSAKTGVHNHVVVATDTTECHISTGEKVGIAVHLYESKDRLFVLVSTGDEIQRYEIIMNEDTARLDGSIQLPKYDHAGNSLNDMCNAIAVHTDRMILACESGLVRLYDISNDSFATFIALCQGHVKAVCAVHWSHASSSFVSSAKDGTARVWNIDTDTHLVTSDAILTCDCTDPKAKKPMKPGTQILVRGCAFVNDMIVTVASP